MTNSKIGDTFIREGNGMVFVYLGVWPRGYSKLPHHIFYAPLYGYEYSVRGAETAKRRFPDWEGVNLLKSPTDNPPGEPEDAEFEHARAQGTAENVTGENDPCR